MCLFSLQASERREAHLRSMSRGTRAFSFFLLCSVDCLRQGPWKNAAQLECGHCFCSACIQTHLKTYQAEKCPTCRQPAQKR